MANHLTSNLEVRAPLPIGSVASKDILYSSKMPSVGIFWIFHIYPYIIYNLQHPISGAIFLTFHISLGVYHGVFYPCHGGCHAAPSVDPISSRTPRVDQRRAHRDQRPRVSWVGAEGAHRGLVMLLTERCRK